MGLDEFGADLRSREPCGNCGGTGLASRAPIETYQPSEIAKQTAIDERTEMQRAPAMFPCPSCNGSGIETDIMNQAQTLLNEIEANGGHIPMGLTG